MLVSQYDPNTFYDIFLDSWPSVIFLITGQNIAGLDEDKLWKYPQGWTPPEHVIADSTKKVAMRRTQRALEEAVVVLPRNKTVPVDKTGKILKDLKPEELVTYDSWKLAKDTSFELTKRTIWRYHEVSCVCQFLANFYMFSQPCLVSHFASSRHHFGKRRQNIGCTLKQF